MKKNWFSDPIIEVELPYKVIETEPIYVTDKFRLILYDMNGVPLRRKIGFSSEIKTDKISNASRSK